jgi:hypothetical protein
MSMSKRFIEQIEKVSIDLQTTQPELSRFECLEKATTQLTGNEKHFSDLHSFYQNSLLEGHQGVDGFVKRKAKKLAKQNSISHKTARRKITASIGVESDENVLKLVEDNRNCEDKRLEMLRKITGRALVDNFFDYLNLPHLDSEELKRKDSESVLIEHFDFLPVPVQACEKLSIAPTYIIENKAFFPIAVVKQNDGKMKDHQLPQEAMAWVMSVLHDVEFDGVKYLAKKNGDGVDFYEVRSISSDT